MKESLKCNVSINRSHGRDNDMPITIRIEDALSGCIAVEAQMSLVEFAECITGRGMCKGEMRFNDSGLIGLTREVKTVEIPVPRELKYAGDREKVKGKALIAVMEVEEVDGWKGRESDLFNSHCYTENGIRVVFTRHV